MADPPLIQAVKSGDYELVKKRVKDGQLEARDKKGFTALIRACQSGYTDIAKCLLEYGGKVNAQSEPNLWSSLMSASESGHLDTVKLLVTYKVRIEDKSATGYTALHFASENGHPDVVSLLLGKGAIVHVTNNHEDTPLHRACQNGHKTTVECLLAHKADCEAKNINGFCVKKSLVTILEQ